jgi:[ribosomal protein S5]-alanine N-acetyltransferase
MEAPRLQLRTARLILSTPTQDLAPAARDFHVRNHAFLAPWSPPTPASFEALGFWQDYAAKSREAFSAGSMVRLWVSPAELPDKVIGSLGFSQIFRGPFCNAILGYQLDEAEQGKGLMSEALAAGIRYMFDEQKLHRIGANYMPHNVRSGRLLAKLGFRIEGYAKDYLFIDGAWRDHILTALTNPQVQQPV